MSPGAAYTLIATSPAAVPQTGVGLYADGEVGLVAKVRHSTLDPAVPVCAGLSEPAAPVNVVEGYDRGPATNSYPLTGADVIAFARKLVSTSC